jgi:hypothetical protein
MAYTKNASPFFVVFMNVLASMNKGLKCLDFWLPRIFPSCLSFYMRWLILIGYSCAKSCSKSNVLVEKVSYFGVVSFTDSKWRLLIFQSIQRLCKTNHDNLMMIGLLKMKWHWKHYYKSEVQFINLNHYGTLKVK